MASIKPLVFLFVFVLFGQAANAQTILDPGDIMVLGINTDLGPCGGKPESDEISFVCFKDITSFTIFHLTDNGWEVGAPGFWGDQEGTLRLQRVGGTIAAGTVITIQAINNNGSWVYTATAPDAGWVITNLNAPFGDFNLENGGDQLYFLQNGTWTTSGGANMATYDGDIIYGFNTGSTWMANGTTQQSNLHPDVLPCFYMNSGSDYAKYTGPFGNGTILDWWMRVQDPANWVSYAGCNLYSSSSPDYAGGFSIPITDLEIGTFCNECYGCPPFDGQLFFQLPPGYMFDLAYTDGTDTFYKMGMVNNSWVIHNITDTTTFSLISISISGGGCPVPQVFSSEATFNAPHNNPGMHNAITVCPDYGIFALGYYLGDHDPGGMWVPPLDPIFNTFYNSYWGPGTYYYVFTHPDCPIDSASIDIYWMDTTGTQIEIGCDQNGTPTDITDDRMVIDIFFTATGDFGPYYQATPMHFAVPYGEILPDNVGNTGEWDHFVLSPGTATLDNLTLQVQGYTGFVCDWMIPLPPPGFCSDPCDHDMNASLTGDIDEMCPNSCPDEPLTLTIEVNGGTEDYTMDLGVSAPGYPGWTFLEQDLGDFTFTDIQVCIGDVAAPTYDPVAHQMVLPKFLAGLDVTISLLNVYDFYHCTAIINNADHILTIHPLPPITTTSLAYCKGVSTNVDLTLHDLQISLLYDVTWFDENPLEGGSEIPTPTMANLQNVGQLWAMIEDDYCPNAIQVPFVILPQPDLDSVPPIQVCDGHGVNLQAITLTDAGNSMATYTFHSALPPDTINRFDTLFFIPPDTTTIYVLATAGMCYDTLPIEIDVQPYPDFTLQALPCDLVQETYGVIFSSNADSIHANFGMVLHHGIGLDSIIGIPNDSTVRIEIINPSGMCKDTVTITAPNCNCPFIAPPVPLQPSYAICDDEAIPVLTVNVPGGIEVNWYDVPSGGVPLLLNSLTYQPASSTSGIYYAEALDPAIQCASIRTSIPLDVYPTALLQPLADQVLCDGNTLNLNAMTPAVLNAVPGTGQWYDLADQQPAGGIQLPQDGDAWYYVFTTSAGNCVTADTFSVQVNPLPTLQVYDIFCDVAALTYDLFFTSGADGIVSNAGTIVQVPGTDSFSLQDIPFDTDIQFNLTIAATGCTSTFLQPAPDCLCPALLQANSTHLCSAQGDIDLSAFIGPGASGTWQMVSTPGGANPATLAGNMFQGAGSDPGTYTLRFVRNVILANCVDTAFFTLQLSESPYADAGTNAAVCAPYQIILNGSAGGDNVLYTWTDSGTSSVVSPGALNTSYTPTLADIAAGAVSFTLTATDQTGFCPSASETITIDIDGTAYFILNPATITYCDTADTDVDLDALVTFGTTSGTWFFPDTVSAPVTGGSHINPTTFAAGNYTVFYTTNNAVLPCKNDTVGVSLIIRNCACPSVALSTPGSALCSESAVQDLSAYLLTTEPGTWSITGKPAGTKPAVINGADFVTDHSDAGTYTLRFTLAKPVIGCPDFAEIDLEVVATPTIQTNKIECADDLQSWVAFIQSGAETVISNLGLTTDLGNGRYQVSLLPLNTSLLVTASNGNGLCTSTLTVTAPDCACTLAINNLPGSAVFCPDDSYTFQPQVTGGKGSVNSYWVIGEDTLHQNALTVNQAGAYRFISIDSLGCQEEHSINVSLYQEFFPDISIGDVSCPGYSDGMILLNDIVGGTGPFTLVLNGGAPQPVGSLPFTLEGLSAGNYTLDILDAFGCSITVQLVVESASKETIALGPDQTILVGDSLRITPVLSFTPDSFYWTGDISLLDVQQLVNWIKPEADQSISLFAIDSKGCLYRDDLFIRVLLVSSIYVPTVFSPNGDGVNDILAPLADPSVTRVDYFQIFSRWGELVYSDKDFIPAPDHGWDGKFNGKAMGPGVFVYRLSATNKRGKVLTKYGDITLVR